jgi:hypothetical protein
VPLQEGSLVTHKNELVEKLDENIRLKLEQGEKAEEDRRRKSKNKHVHKVNSLMEKLLNKEEKSTNTKPFSVLVHAPMSGSE